jgi:8-oxo-dGTP pyrophosphatase MutT (NUDIX family)
MIPYKNTQLYKDYIKRHDIHFNGKYHAAFFLLINESLDEVFLVKNKYTNQWSIPGGRLDMKGVGR